MFNWNEFDKIFNDLFSLRSGFDFGDNTFEKKTYKSPDGSFSFTMYTNKRNNGNKTNELSLLKQKLELAVDEQNFEKAVELRDKIKNMEQNFEKINLLQNELNECVKNQDFENAIKLRDQIKSLK